jgi:phytoene desaturase (3,4-didehydrolycopene-forming)
VQVVEALVNIGKRSGVEYMFDTPISSITLSADGKRATGISFKDDTKAPLTADLVICNADLTYAYNNLLPTTTYGKSLESRKASCSSISFYWALDRQFPELSAHNIFLAEDYKESFDSIFKKHLIPDQPSFYVNVPSRVDDSAAPPGCDSIVILVPVGHLSGPHPDSHKGSEHSTGTTQDWPAMIASARQTVLSILEQRLHVSLAAHIIDEVVNTPPSWKDTFNLDRGAILGLSHSFFNVLSFRPKTKHASIEDLYFVGASTHPGTGVPIVLAGAKLISDEILDKLRQERRVPRGKVMLDETSERGSPLDRVQRGALTSVLQWVLLMLFALAVVYGFGGESTRRLAGDW